MKKVAILQSNYLPWKGYFDIIHDVDLFIFYDDVQYTKNDWRNRNKIKTTNGASWITIPVGTNLNRLVCEVELQDSTWATKHWNSIRHAYCKTPYFNLYKDFFEDEYLGQNWKNLSQLNQYLIKYIANTFLGIKTDFGDSREYEVTGEKQERLISLLKRVNTDVYVSGPSAKNYIDDEVFKAANIELIYKNYLDYPEYPQLYPPFEHGVSIIDLLFQVGPAAPEYIWGWRKEGMLYSTPLNLL